MLGVEVGVLIVATWFAMRSCTLIRLAFVLYRCCFGILWVSAAFYFSDGGIGLVSSGIICGTCWDGRLGARTGWNVMSPRRSTLKGGAGAASGIVYGVCTLRGGATCGEDTLLKISVSFWSAAV